jgi:hypothetical protein
VLVHAGAIVTELQHYHSTLLALLTGGELARSRAQAPACGSVDNRKQFGSSYIAEYQAIEN